MIVGTDGSRRRITSDGGEKSSPVWSQDGKRMFFVHSKERTVRYYVTTASVLGG